jgi:hypothetical protein
VKKAKYLFVLKFIGYSLALFAFGHELLHEYALLLGQGIDIVNSTYHVPPNIERFLYGTSMIIIAFLALILSTPAISKRKKAAIIVIGTIALFLTDLSFIKFVIFPQGQLVANVDSLAFEMYLCIKLMIPFLLWIVPGYSYLCAFFKDVQEIH